MDDGPAILIMFLLGFLTDILYTWSIRHIAKGNTLQSACGNAMLTAVGLTATWVIIDNQSILDAIVYVVACFCGTFVVMYKGKKKCDCIETSPKACEGCRICGDDPHVHYCSRRK